MFICIINFFSWAHIYEQVLYPHLRGHWKLCGVNKTSFGMNVPGLHALTSSLITVTTDNILTHFQNSERAVLPLWEPRYRGKNTELGVGDQSGTHCGSSQLASLGFISLPGKWCNFAGRESIAAESHSHVSLYWRI